MKLVTRLVMVFAMVGSLVVSASAAGAQSAEEAEAADALEEEGGFDVELEPLEDDPLLGFTFEEWLPVYALQREMLGFKELSPNRLRQLAQSNAGRKSLEEIGFVLTPAEQREMSIREDFSEEVEDVVRPIAESIPGFAGLYVDDNFRHVVGFVGMIGLTDRQALQNAVSKPGRLRIRTGMAYTEAQIEDMAEEAREAFADMDGVRIDPSLEEGVIEVRTPPTATQAVQRMGRSSSMAGLRVVEDLSDAEDAACTWRYKCHTPLRGGIKAKNEDRNQWCTTGFWVTKNSTATDYLLVNAHCADPGDVYRIGGYKHATLHYASSAVRETTLDTQGILLPQSQSSDRFYRVNHNKNRQIRVRKSNSSIKKNDLVCVHSYKVNRICGAIDNVSVDESAGAFATEDNFRFTIQLPGQWVCSGSGTDPFAISGSSGAPVTERWGQVVYGQFHTCDNVIYYPGQDVTTMRMWASKAENIEDELGVTINTLFTP